MGCARRRFTLRKRFSVKAVASINLASCAVSTRPGPAVIVVGTGSGPAPTGWACQHPRELAPWDVNSLTFGWSAAGEGNT